VKLFLAWSGPTSRRLAEFMREWIPSVVQAIKPFMSSQDIRKGRRWTQEIGTQLSEADFALLCLTPANLTSPWINFEAGAVSGLDRGGVSALLLEVSPTNVEFPLQQFQHTRLAKDDLWQLIQVLNGFCRTPLTETRLCKAFDRAYPEVEAEIENLKATLSEEQKGASKPVRSTEAVLADILATQQAIESRLERMSARRVGQGTPRRPASLHMRARRRPAPRNVPIREDIIQREFGELLRRYRIARGLSLETLSMKSDIHQRYLLQMERGIQAATIRMLCRLSRAFDLSPAAMILDLQMQLAGRPTRLASSSKATSATHLN
jgi:ribosome-binding protein aMBF1 (putative translation factor)